MKETQYINLFNEQRDKINKKSIDVLNRSRDKAFESFKKLGFPTKKLEDYSYVDLSESFASNFSINLDRNQLKGNPYKDFKSDTPIITQNLFFVQNDILYTDNAPQLDLPKNVFVGSITEFAKQNPDILDKHYGKLANTEENALAAFNTSFVQDAFIVYVPKNTIVEKPIQIINLLNANTDTIANRRILVIAEENSQVKILGCDYTQDSAKYIVTQVVEIFADKNAIVDFYELEKSSEKTVRISSTYVEQKESSDVVVNNICLESGLTRNNFHVNLNGEYAEGYVCGMIIADKKQYVDNFVFLDHLVPNCTSTQLFKYVLLDNAVGSFCGRIRVERDAQKTMAYQTNNNLCISPTSRMYSKPQLEIYADDVKCSHGLTTGELNEEALLYLCSRGVSRQEAQLMLMQAFVSEVLEHIRIEELKDELGVLIEKRFKEKIS